MSSHYIYLKCSTPECETREEIYTGNIQADLFSDAGPASFEGETIELVCLECQAANVQLAAYQRNVHRSDCALHNGPAMAPRVCNCGALEAASSV
jgi:hypothetical protein